MKISIGWNPICPDPSRESAVLDMVLAQAVQADQAGFACLYFTEHHFAGIAPWGNPFMMAAHVAGKIEQAHVGFAIAVVPLHHPIRLAEQANFLDQVTKGKFILGLGGGGISTEFAGFGLHSDDSSRLHDEIFSTVRKLWAKKPEDAPIEFDIADGAYRGQLLQRIMPGHYRAEGPRIKVAVTSSERMRSAVENGWSAFLFPPMVPRFRKALQAQGHPQSVVDDALAWTSCSMMAYVADTDEQAIDEATEMMKQRTAAQSRMQGFEQELSWMRQKPTPTMVVGSGPEGSGIAGAPGGGGGPKAPAGLPPLPPGMSMEKIMIQMGLVGSAETVIRKVKDLADMGIPEVSIGMDLGSYTDDTMAKVKRALDLFSDKVMPALEGYEPDLKHGEDLVASMPMPPIPGLVDAA